MLVGIPFKGIGITGLHDGVVTRCGEDGVTRKACGANLPERAERVAVRVLGSGLGSITSAANDALRESTRSTATIDGINDEHLLLLGLATEHVGAVRIDTREGENHTRIEVGSRHAHAIGSDGSNLRTSHTARHGEGRHVGFGHPVHVHEVTDEGTAVDFTHDVIRQEQGEVLRTERVEEGGVGKATELATATDSLEVGSNACEVIHAEVGSSNNPCTIRNLPTTGDGINFNFGSEGHATGFCDFVHEIFNLGKAFPSTEFNGGTGVHEGAGHLTFRNNLEVIRDVNFASTRIGLTRVGEVEVVGETALLAFNLALEIGTGGLNVRHVVIDRSSEELGLAVKAERIGFVSHDVVLR